jgi:hypothetical protein
VARKKAKTKRQVLPTKETVCGDYTVGFYDKRHIYKVQRTDGADDIRIVPSCTKVTRLIDDGKSGRLMGWAAGMVAQKFDKLARGYRDGDTVSFDVEALEYMCTSAKGAYREKVEDAADIGRAVHEHIEKHILWVMNGGRKPPVPKDPVIKACFDEYIKWEELREPEYIGTEEIIYHPEEDYCGTFDCLARINTPQGGRALTVIDFKTSNYFYDEFYLQIEAYRRALPWKWDIEATHGLCLKLDKEGAPCEEHWVGPDDEGKKHQDTSWLAFKCARQLLRWTKV